MGEGEREKHQRWQWLARAGERWGGTWVRPRQGPAESHGLFQPDALAKPGARAAAPSASCASPPVSPQSPGAATQRHKAELAHRHRRSLDVPSPAPCSPLLSRQLPSAADMALFRPTALSRLPATSAVRRTCRFLICSTRERLLSPF